ncbi:hypothetical protein ABW21_db0205551 [Orbilia brochopaga]|nr:hypothetical protein ABW21_db0205551 [Drechslerella brochopaga]
MASADIQGLLRFLTGPAKIPLRDALAKAKPLLADGLSSPEVIAKASLENLHKIFPDEKLAKQVLSAAKRATNSSSSPKKKKRPANDSPSDPKDSSTTSPSKRRRPNNHTTVTIDSSNPQSWESGLTLPPPSDDIPLISSTTITVNRAPLLLAFAVVSLSYTHPWMPASSRFSLAQGLLDATAASKAKYLGINRDSQNSQDVEEGYKRIKVLGKDIPVLRRWDVSMSDPETSVQDDDAKSQKTASMNPSSSIAPDSTAPTTAATAPSSSTAPAAATVPATATATEEPIYWALSPSLLSQPPAASKLNPSALPIHLPHASHSYLTRAFPDSLPLLLGALHAVYRSWEGALTATEMDSRGWNWYCRVRPAVEDGPGGWGGRGVVKLSDVLSLRKAG